MEQFGHIDDEAAGLEHGGHPLAVHEMRQDTTSREKWL
jgi:hypothetical protein